MFGEVRANPFFLLCVRSHKRVIKIIKSVNSYCQEHADERPQPFMAGIPVQYIGKMNNLEV